MALKVWQTIYDQVDFDKPYPKIAVLEEIKALEGFCGQKNVKHAIGTRFFGMSDTLVDC